MATSSGLFLATIYNQSQLVERKHVVDKHCRNGCSIKRAPLSVSYYNEISSGHIGSFVVRMRCSAGPVMPLWIRPCLCRFAWCGPELVWKWCCVLTQVMLTVVARRTRGRRALRVTARWCVSTRTQLLRPIWPATDWSCWTTSSGSGEKYRRRRRIRIAFIACLRGCYRRQSQFPAPWPTGFRIPEQPRSHELHDRLPLPRKVLRRNSSQPTLRSLLIAKARRCLPKQKHWQKQTAFRPLPPHCLLLAVVTPSTVKLQNHCQKWRKVGFTCSFYISENCFSL